MRVSQGVPCGRNVHLYHPDLLYEHEEVVIYTREDFKRTCNLMQEQIDFIIKADMRLRRGGRRERMGKVKEYRLMGVWPRVMERVNILGLEMDSFFSDKPIQAYLDSYIYSEVKTTDDHATASMGKVSAESFGVSWL